MASYGALGTPFNPPLPFPPPLRALKVNQLDALRLDKELLRILRHRFSSLFTLWRPFPSLQPDEIDALFRALLWAGTVWRDRPSPGNQLQNLHYASIKYRGPQSHAPALSLRTKLGFFFFYVFLPYIGKKLRETGSVNFRRFVSKIESVLEFIQWLNLLAFLSDGVYSTVRDRILKIRLVHINPLSKRLLSLEYMHRFLLWNGLQEFLLNVMPSINVERVKAVLLQKLGLTSSTKGCGFCGQSFPLTLPVAVDCGHEFCYYCAALEMQENAQPKCVRCNEIITEIQTKF